MDWAATRFSPPGGKWVSPPPPALQTALSIRPSLGNAIKLGPRPPTTPRIYRSAPRKGNATHPPIQSRRYRIWPAKYLAVDMLGRGRRRGPNAHPVGGGGVGAPSRPVRQKMLKLFRNATIVGIRGRSLQIPSSRRAHARGGPPTADPVAADGSLILIISPEKAPPPPPSKHATAPPHTIRGDVGL